MVERLLCKQEASGSIPLFSIMYYFPDIDSIYSSLMGGFFTKDEINPNLNLLNINYEKCRDEYESARHRLVFNEGKEAYQDCKIATLFGRYHPSMDLAELERVYDQGVYVDPEREIFYTQNTVYVPTLFNLCLEVGIRQRCSINLLEPGKVIDWHTDLDPQGDDDLIIRGLWGLSVNPQNQETCQLLVDSKEGVQNQILSNNSMHFFWGRTKHHVFNNLTTPRACLSFGIVVPQERIL